jgi:hypothetical protein
MLHLKHLAFEVEPVDLTAKMGTDEVVSMFNSAPCRKDASAVEVRSVHS